MSLRRCLLLSGGLDSYTAGAIAKADGYELYALTIRYGQVHAREIEAARRVAAALGVARHLELDVPLSKIGGSALVGDGAIPKDRRARRDRDIPVHLRAGAQHRVPVARDGLGRSRRRRGHRDRRQRARLLRLSRLPARVPARVRAARRAGDEGRRRGTVARDPVRRCWSSRRPTSSAAASRSAWTTA